LTRETHMLGYGLVFFSAILLVLFALEVAGWAEPDFDDKKKILSFAFAAAFLSSSLREAFKTREDPVIWRCSALLLLANLFCFVTDFLADDSLAGNKRPPARHVVATMSALLLDHALHWCSIIMRMSKYQYVTLKAAGNGTQSAHSRRVLILYANVGSGHKMAALALEAAFRERNEPDLEVKLIDLMECAPALFRSLFQTQFQKFTQSLAGQHALGFMYDAADKGRAKASAQRLVEAFVSLELIKKVATEQPEVVICTHFLPAQVLSDLRSVHRRFNQTVRLQAQELPLCLVLTDLDLQYMWVNKVDKYFVPRQTAVLMLKAYGALANGAQVQVSGIPIYPAFASKALDARTPDRAEEHASRLRELEALGAWEGSAPNGWPAADDERPVVLYISSGNAVQDIYSYLLQSETPLRLVVCTGRQADVRKSLEAVPIPPRHAVKMLGFVADKPPTPGGMPTLYRCADLFVGKSGGLAVAEAAALCVPMIVLDPIPGQEQRNADVLLELGAALKVNDFPLLPHRVDECLRESGAKAKAMASAIAKLGRPNAAVEIADAVIRKEVVPIYRDRAKAE